MMVATFDTFHYIKKLKEAGISEQQAEIQVEMIEELIGNIDSNTATKNDLELLRRDIAKDLVNLKNALIIKVGGMLVVAVGVLAAIIKL